MSKTNGDGKELLEMSYEEENKFVDVITADYEIKGIAYKKFRDAEIKFRELERKVNIMKEQREIEQTIGSYCSLCSNKFRIFDRIKICGICKFQVCKKCIDDKCICGYCRTKDIFLRKRKEFRTLCPYTNTQFGIHKFFCKLEVWRQRAKLEFHVTRLLGDTFENCPIFVKIDDPPLNECFKRLQKEILDYAFSNELGYISSAYRDFYRQLNRLWNNIPGRMNTKNRFILNVAPVVKLNEESHPASKYYLSLAHAVAYKCEVILREKIQKIEIEEQKNLKLRHLPHAHSIPRYPEHNSYKNCNLYQTTNRYFKNSEQFNTLTKPPLLKIPSNKMNIIDLSSRSNKKSRSQIMRYVSGYDTNQDNLYETVDEKRDIQDNDDNDYMSLPLNDKNYNTNEDNLIKITMDRKKIKSQSGKLVIVSCKIYCPKDTIIKKDHIIWLSANNKLIEIGGKNQFHMDDNCLQSNGYYNLELLLFDLTKSFNGSIGICALVNEKIYFNYCTLIIAEESLETTEDCSFPKGIQIEKKEHGKIIVKVQPIGYPTPWVEFTKNNKTIQDDGNHKITTKNGIWYLEISNMIQATSVNGQFSRSNLRNISTTLSSFEIVAIARNRFGSATIKGSLLGDEKIENQKNIVEYEQPSEGSLISSNNTS
ncbi:Zinc finger, RING/FYVE/PHD-type domain and Immunoglobulin-like fold domain-containing protein [Strongyloides ratti]|uniref:Zinc finger, RING/FYVE/PHD-type domain and Immunoglobulin-like fold domain-containing protein n=1 Tax=Strongyloides ratti TaxID=34506 RepID=A0A090L8U6_STRRB|nr:Zinc finger, RING/FYVE/PHD-type domain and Immunoglobulin-like fold domain-containing protein [Strongyloides ratti]CEF63930.1 Zinc finger, RING/FYVE/PHD-type domain and Immunoglobulin-like fold domain-containing protein [Strongyloides ratti]